MGGLFGSEYWTYLLPRRVGLETATRLTRAPFEPIGTAEAVRIGLIDEQFGDTLEEFRARTHGLADELARDADLGRRLELKRRERARDERRKPLRRYRDEELARSYACFFGPDPSYHDARRRFVYKATDLPESARAASRSA